MNVAVLGTGSVGRTLSAKLDELGHGVSMGTRDPEAKLEKAGADPDSFPGWRERHPDIALTTFKEAASGADLVVNATSGAASLAVLEAVGEEGLADKILLDVANPLGASHGMPPTLTVANDDSLAEQIQRRFPRAKVVKGLNMINARVMVAPAELAGGDHTIMIAGDDTGAKEQVISLLRSFGWSDVIDLGDVTAARGAEMYLALWLRLLGALDTAMFNIKIVR